MLIAGAGANLAAVESPYQKADESWISISGTVVDPTADSFILDYGEGLVTVEMDDWDWYGDAYGLLDGDKVTVNGRIDDDLFETTTIEASSVYVESLGSYFYASAADEEDATYSTVVTAPVVVSTVSIRGKVTSVDAIEGEFTIDTGARQVTVDTEDLAYNPLDDKGYQKIEKGHRVSVSGELDVDLFGNREVDADWVITLSKDEDKGASMNKQ
ncbi:MAG: hypothetical protein ACOCZK_03710 [Planctomycetota bacterium]